MVISNKKHRKYLILYPHGTEEETKAQRGSSTHSRSYAQHVAALHLSWSLASAHSAKPPTQNISHQTSFQAKPWKTLQAPWDKMINTKNIAYALSSKNS